jgi:hypothetical protein
MCRIFIINRVSVSESVPSESRIRPVLAARGLGVSEVLNPQGERGF